MAACQNKKDVQKAEDHFCRGREPAQGQQFPQQHADARVTVDSSSTMCESSNAKISWPARKRLVANTPVPWIFDCFTSAFFMLFFGLAILFF